MTDERVRRAFISYVKEDRDRVDGLCRVLDAAGIPYWRDRGALAPGDAWKAKIREAIRSGSLVFLACFSDRSAQREASYMNEELTLAVDEFRKRPPERTWLIPIRFSDVTIPEWDLGAGRTLHDIQHADLFGERHAQEAAALVTTIGRVLGTSMPDLISAAASVAEAADGERPKLMRRLTKEMITNSSRRIELDDLIGGEVRRIATAMRDADRFPTTLASNGSNEEQVTEIASTAARYGSLAVPFCTSLHIAARWAEADALTPWVSGLRALCLEADRVQSGDTALLAMRWLPALLATFTAGLSATSVGRFENMKTLLVDNMVPIKNGEGRAPVIDAVHPWKPFRAVNDIVPSVVARSAITGEEPVTAYEAFTKNRVGKYHTPVAEWLHVMLRPVFEDQFLDQDTYDSDFDRAEILFGLVSQDLAAERHSGDPERAWLISSQWFGRSTWRNGYSRTSSLDEVYEDYRRSGLSWPPLTAGLFGGNQERVDRAVSGYAEQYNRLRRNRF